MEMPKAWQTFPIAMHHWGEDTPSSCEENLISALESKHFSRVCRISFVKFSSLPWWRFTAVMEKPCPELTDISFSSSEDNEMPVLSQSFLGGSAASHLRTLYLNGVSPLAMQRLLLSANNLVYLALDRIPDSRHHSPEDMANCLSGLTRLESLNLNFCPPRYLYLSQVSRPLLLSLAPSVLPALTELDFKGRIYYLEGLVARIDAPLLLELHITFFHHDAFDVPQLHRFISHAKKLGTHTRATVSYYDAAPRLRLSSQPRTVDSPVLTFWISYNIWSYPYLPLSSLGQVFTSLLPLISTLEELDIIGTGPTWIHSGERMRWPELLGLLTSLKTLRLGKDMAPQIIHALSELTEERERVMLPALESLFIEAFLSSEVIQDVVKQFFTARQLSGRYVAVRNWLR